VDKLEKTYTHFPQNCSQLILKEFNILFTNISIWLISYVVSDKGINLVNMGKKNYPRFTCLLLPTTTKIINKIGREQ